MSMNHFFDPKSVAIIGASRDPAKPGHVIFRNFLEGTFKGSVYPVNPRARELFGQPCYKSVLDIPAKIDLAVIIVPAPAVPQVLEECGRAGIKATVIISAGFKEVGNTRLENRVKSIAERHNIRIIGVNCIGIYDPYSGVDTIFNPRYKLERPEKGSISFITQSGALGTVVLDWMAMKGYKISKFISYGNATDINETDLIKYLAKDDTTSVICAYFEGLEQGRKFFNTAKELSKKKPIIAQKGGTTPAGHRAVASHTGSLAGAAEIYSAAFKQSGIIQAANMEELFDFARLLSTQPLPRGDRVQIITDGGGFGVMMVDSLVKNGLQLATMSPPRTRILKSYFPDYFVLGNPIDLTGDATSEHYATALEQTLRDPCIDMIALIVLFQVPSLTPEVTEVITEASRRSTKPIVVIAAGGRYTEVLKKSLEDSGVPCFSCPARAAKALKVLYDYGKYKRSE